MFFKHIHAAAVVDDIPTLDILLGGKLHTALAQGKLPGKIGLAAAHGEHGLVQSFGQGYVVVGTDLEVAPGKDLHCAEISVVAR